MVKKKKGKSQKYAAAGSDESGKGKTSSNKKAEQRGKPRRSKRARRPIETNNVDDYKFRQEVEGRITCFFVAAMRETPA